MRRPRFTAALTVLSLAVALAACGGDDESGSEESGSGAEPPPDPTALWVTSGDAEEVYRIDLESAEITDTVPVEGYPLDVDVAFGSVWVAVYTNGIARIDPDTGDVETIEVDNATDVAVGDDTLWVGQSDPVGVVSVDPESGEMGEAIELPENADPEEMVWDDGVLYASSGYDSTIYRIDTESGDVATLETEGPVTDLTVAGDALFVADFYAMLEVDAESLEVDAEHELEEDRPWALAVDGTQVWIASQGADLTALDLVAGDLTGDVAELGGDAFTDGAEEIVVVDDSVWMAKGGGDVLRIDPASSEVLATATLPEAPGEAHVAVE
jgi:glutamine cyclotransferase